MEQREVTTALRELNNTAERVHSILGLLLEEIKEVREMMVEEYGKEVLKESLLLEYLGTCETQMLTAKRNVDIGICFDSLPKKEQGDE